MLFYRAAAADTRLRAQITASAGGNAEATTKHNLLRVAKAYCARYILLKEDFSLLCVKLLSERYNGFRGSICVTGMKSHLGQSGTRGNMVGYIILSGFSQSVDCEKRNQTSVFRTSLIQSKHMVMRVAS